MFAQFALVVMMSAGCVPDPSPAPKAQSPATKSPIVRQKPPVVPTMGSQDAANGRIVDGSNAKRVQWPAGDVPEAVVEVQPNQTLRWKAEYPLAQINDLLWSPNGNFLAVGGMIHDREKELFRSPTLVYSPDGVVVEELITEVSTGNGAGGSVSDLEWSNNGEILAAAGGLNMSATLFYPGSSRKLDLAGVALSVHAVKFSPDGKYFVLVTGDRDLYLYDNTGQRIGVVGPAGTTVRSVAWHPDGKMLASSDPLGVMLWELRQKQSESGTTELIELVPTVRINIPLEREQWVATLEWSHDGSRLAVGAFGTGDVWLIDRQGQPLGILRGHAETVWRTSFSAKGILATTSSDNTTRLWDQDGTPIAVLISAPPEDSLIDVVAWSPDGNLLAVVSPSEVICLYRSDAMPKAKLIGHSGNIQAIDWHPAGKRLASADDKKVTHLWNLPSSLD